MERMNETLRHFLERQQGKLTLQEQIRISLEITQGVAFLHQLTPPMVHRDLNDKNVMFTFDGVPKIGDFGQSRLKQDLYLTTVQPGMVMFMPPEALSDGNSKYDESLDMFSLGVLMLEIGTQQLPLVNMVGIGIIPEVRRREKDLGRMENLHPLKQHVVLCLSDEQKQRPKATELQCILRTLIAGEERFCRMEVGLLFDDALWGFRPQFHITGYHGHLFWFLRLHYILSYSWYRHIVNWTVYTSEKEAYYCL